MLQVAKESYIPTIDWIPAKYVQPPRISMIGLEAMGPWAAIKVDAV